MAGDYCRPLAGTRVMTKAGDRDPEIVGILGDKTGG